MRAPILAYFTQFNIGIIRPFSEIKTAMDEQVASFFEPHAKAQADPWNSRLPIRHSARKKLWKEVWGDQWHPVYSFEQSCWH